MHSKSHGMFYGEILLQGGVENLICLQIGWDIVMNILTILYAKQITFNIP